MKIRLDQLLVNEGFFPSRERAKAAIMAGVVHVDQQKIDKPGTKVDQQAKLVVKGADFPYVSRGGLKLEKAIKTMGFTVDGKVVLDVGASTGGFTDCALQNGAIQVIAVDVGYGQLAWSLRQDPRVKCLERTNIRYLTLSQLQELTGIDAAQVATIDVAFISLEKVLPPVRELLKPAGQVLALIKPQFEAGRDKVGKKGVVRDPQVHIEVITRVIRFAHELGFKLVQLEYSPITGPEGNIEYLLWLMLPEKDIEQQLDDQSQEIIAKVVQAAFTQHV